MAAATNRARRVACRPPPLDRATRSADRGPPDPRRRRSDRRRVGRPGRSPPVPSSSPVARSSSRTIHRPTCAIGRHRARGRPWPPSGRAPNRCAANGTGPRAAASRRTAVSRPPASEVSVRVRRVRVRRVRVRASRPETGSSDRVFRSRDSESLPEPPSYGRELHWYRFFRLMFPSSHLPAYDVATESGGYGRPEYDAEVAQEVA